MRFCFQRGTAKRSSAFDDRGWAFLWRMVLAVAWTMMFGADSSGQNLVRNGNFAQSNTGAWVFAGSFGGPVGPGGLEYISIDGSLYQDLATELGKRYILSFGALGYGVNSSPGRPAVLRAYWESNLVATFDLTDRWDWQYPRIAVTAGRPRSRLRFEGTNAVNLDDVSVVAASDSDLEVRLVSPLRNAEFVQDASITLEAEVGVPSGGSIAEVAYFRSGATLLGRSTSPPFSVVWSNAVPGRHDLTARVTDGRGVSVTSLLVPIVVRARPLVRIDEPSPEAVFTNGRPFSIRASVLHAELGRINDLEVLRNGTSMLRIQEVTADSYTATWDNPVEGHHVFTVVGKSTAGVPVSVSNVLVHVMPASVLDLAVSASGGWAMAGEREALGQTFVSRSDGRLHHVDLRLMATTVQASWARIEITEATNGLPGGRLLGSASIPSWEVSAPVDWNSVFFPSNHIRLYAGRQYAIILTAEGPDGYVDWAMNTGDFYGAGSLFQKSTNGRWEPPKRGSPPVTYPGADAGFEVHVVPDARPSVTITSPSSGTLVDEGSLLVSARATDTSGIVRVDFFANLQRIGTSWAGENPRTVTWAGASPGVYALTAEATDAAGFTNGSSPVYVVINARPRILWRAPADGSSGISGEPFELMPDVSDWDGTVTRVDYAYWTPGMSAPVPFASRSAPPFGVVATNLPPALSNSLQVIAWATDNRGSTSTPAVVQLTMNTRPRIHLDVPRDGQLFQEGEPIVAEATASNRVGAVARVEMVAVGDDGGSIALGRWLGPPYRVVWENAPVGRHRLRAEATSIFGISGTSSPVMVRVNGRPGIRLSRAELIYTEGDGAVRLDPQAVAGDVDWPGAGVLAVRILNGLPEDRLMAAGASVRGSEPLVLSLGPGMGLEAVQAVLRGVTYENLSSRPATTERRVRLELSDTDGGRGEAVSLVVEVRAVNGPPKAGPVNLTLMEDERIAIPWNVEDPDGDAFTIRVLEGPVHGRIQGTGTNLVYVPNADYFGPDTFTFVAFDGQAGSEAGTVRLTILPVNDPPVPKPRVTNAIQIDAASSNGVLIALDNRRAVAVLDATFSVDVDGDPLVHAWWIDGGPFLAATGAVARVELELGEHAITLMTDDGQVSQAATAFVEVVTPAEALDEIVLALRDADLPRARRRSIVVTVKTAQALFDRGNLHGGVRVLRAAVHKLRACSTSTNSGSVQAIIGAMERILSVLAP